MALSSALPQSAAARRARPIFIALAAAILVAGIGVGWFARRGAVPAHQAIILLTCIDLALGIMGLWWLIQGIEHQHRSLKVSEASLQSQVVARARELESANARLQVATKVNALLALCAQHMPNAVIITDASGMILWTNTAWEKSSGWSQARSARQPLERVLAETWDGFDADHARRLLRSGKPTEIQARAPGPHGRTRWFNVDFQPVRNELQEVVNVIVLIDDFTEQREADLRIQSANERLQFALRSSGYGIWETYLSDGRVEWDDRMCEIYGVDRQSFGNSLSEWYALMHPDDVEQVKAKREQVISGAVGTLEVEFRIIRPDGTLRHIEARGFLHRSAEGSPQRFIGLNRDITAERQMRETLRVAEERLELALLATDESVWDWDLPAGQIYRDRRWAELIGETTASITEPDGRWTARVHPDDLPAVQAALEGHLKGRTPVYMAEYRLRIAGGRWMWTLDRGRVVSRDREGHALRMVGTQGDITDRKQLEERLRHSEEISIQVSRLAQIGAWEYEATTGTMRWEPELFRIAEVELGYRPTLPEMIRLVPDEHGEILASAVELALAEGRSFDLECPFVTAQGRRRWVRLFGRPGLSEGRPVRIIGAVQEITERHEAVESQRKLESQLFQVQKMETLGTLAGGIAHDFNNLLTGIIGYIDLSIDQLDEEHSGRRCLVEARNACNRACELVEQILVFSRQTGNAERTAIDIGVVIEEARRFLRATVPSTVQIEVEIAPNCARVLADPAQLSQVLLNLGSNAAHAMRTGNGLLRIAVAPALLNAAQAAAHGNLAAGQYVLLRISDTGHGMNAETQKRIFDPFFTTKNVGEGTGLGLAIVHGIVRGHGGSIEVESAPGKGTTFRVYLPAAAQHADYIEVPSEPAPRGEGEVICVVDDEQIVAQATRLTLEKFGYKTVTFTSSEDCLKALRQEPDGCSLLLTDQTMPGLTGMELAAKVREFSPRLPIVVMSGYFSKVSAGSLEEIGNISLLAKPFRANELARVVREALSPGLPA